MVDATGIISPNKRGGGTAAKHEISLTTPMNQSPADRGFHSNYDFLSSLLLEAKETVTLPT